MQFSFIRNIYFVASDFRRSTKPSIFRKHFPSFVSFARSSSVLRFRKMTPLGVCVRQKTFVPWRKSEKSGFSNKKGTWCFFLIIRKISCVHRRKEREGVYIKHLYFFPRLVWYIFASFFSSPLRWYVQGTFFLCCCCTFHQFSLVDDADPSWISCINFLYHFSHAMKDGEREMNRMVPAVLHKFACSLNSNKRLLCSLTFKFNT